MDPMNEKQLYFRNSMMGLRVLDTYATACDRSLKIFLTSFVQTE